ncbi:hypothetical protein EV401DRAFT_1895713 [Pisolithus croceorrhizus]|nr:hypothetical protein EV401DRAFT_1895713 [Pisolithus croceorrhizus]
MPPILYIRHRLFTGSGTRGTGCVQCTLSEKTCAWVRHAFNLIRIVAHLKWIFLETPRTLMAASFLHNEKWIRTSIHGDLIGTATELAVWRVFLLAGMGDTARSRTEGTGEESDTQFRLLTRDRGMRVQSFITVTFTVSVPEEVVIVVVVSSLIRPIKSQWHGVQYSTHHREAYRCHLTLFELEISQGNKFGMPVGTSHAQMNKKAKLSTSQVHHVIVSRKFSRGVAWTVNEILGPKRLETRAMEAKECQRARFEALHKGHENFFQPETDDVYDVTSILDGSKSIDFSHGGSELHDLARDLFNEMKNIEDGGWQKCRMDYRTCHDCAQHQIDAFAREMPELVWAYLEWSANSADSNNDQVQLYVLGIFCAEKCALWVRTEDYSVSSALVHQGVVPIALDVYLQMHLIVSDLVLKALCCDTPDWRLRNSCPACMYTLEDEPDLKFKLLFAMDGNDLLKCISRAAIGSYESTARDIGEQFSFIDQFGVGVSNKSLTEPMPLYLQSDNDNPCAGRWKNMKGDVTSRMWGIFDEAGIFMAVCRHGFSLVITDIVQSSEQAKYLLTVVSKLLDMFRDNLVGSYDIGSRYVDGLGLKDLEGCECTFSKTNGLVLAVHYARYVAHNDEYEVYQNLIFSAWLLEEKEYLTAHSRKPKEETLQMEYWQKLVNLDVSQKHLNDLAWTVATPSSTSTSSFVQKDINFEKDLKMAQDLKIKLGITKHWVPEDEEWQTTGHLVMNRKYQHCLDQLESLVVAQIFELLKMNQAGTATRACSPLCHQLTFEQVVEYTFLADFDLLRHATHEDISQHPWASPAAWAAMDQYFRVCRAEEEIKCLNIEVHHIITYLRDEDCYLKACTTVAGKSTKTEPGDSAGEPATIIPSAISIATTPTFPPAVPDSGDDSSNQDELDTDEDEYGDNCNTLTLQEIIRISSDGYGVQE